MRNMTPYRRKIMIMGTVFAVTSILYFYVGWYVAEGVDRTLNLATGVGLLIFSIWFLYDQLA